MATTRPAPAGARRVVAVLGVGLLLGAAIAVIVREPWHGPILLSLSTGHGISVGDLLVVPLVALAVVIGRRLVVVHPRTRARPTGRWIGPASAVGVGAIVVAATATALVEHGTLVPSGGGTLDGAVLSVAGGSPSPVGVWSYVAVTYDGARLRLFVDGAPVATRATTGTLARSDDPLWLGGNHPYGEYFDGLIDEARIYDRALDEAEIRADMATPVAAGSRDAVAAYSFDAGTDTSVPDDSGHGNAGTITGASWTTHGRYGGALRFDGRDLVRVPASPSLDMTSDLTMSAWIRPTADQSGWRTVMHRERDTYFLVAGSGLEGSSGWVDHLVTGAVVAAAAWLAVVTLATRARWLGPRRRAWRLGLGMVLAGCLADAAIAPTGTLFGPALLAVWFAISARDRIQAVAGWLVAAALVAASVASITDRAGIRSSLEKHGGGLARSASLGITLCVIGLATLATARDPRAAGTAER